MTAERTSGRDIRSWIAVEPVGARGVADPEIPSVPVVADRLLGIGLCEPPGGGIGGQPATAKVLWFLSGESIVALRLDELERVTGFGEGEGDVYRPPRDLADSSGAWPTGRYFMEVRASGTRSLWFAFRVAPPPAAQPTPRGSS